MTDPIADMLSALKNALLAKKESVDIPHSKIKENIAGILSQEGYVRDFSVLSRMKKKFIRLVMRYEQKKPVLKGAKRVSKPGRRMYSGANLPRVQSGYGMAIVSTSKGVMSDEQARRQKLGGEVLCYVW